ncbi:MAG: hypothetical protein QXH13_03245, partial [Thermoplasmata archaeon]
MKKQKRKLSSILAYIGGFLLIVAGYSAHNELLEEILSYLGSLEIGAPFVSIFLTILVLLGALGGFTVVAGGYLVARNHVRIGSFLISTGSGFVIIELLIFLAVKYNVNLWKGFE